MKITIMPFSQKQINTTQYKTNPSTKTKNNEMDRASSSNAFLPNTYYLPFKGLGIRFNKKYVNNVTDKEYQGTGLYKEDGVLDFEKVGWKQLSKEQLDITKASDKEIYAFYHALALAETNDTTWVRRYNKFNVPGPLATYHTLEDERAHTLFAYNLQKLLDVKYHKMLDVPITDKNGDLSIDCVVFDTETTGLNLTNIEKPLDKIIQIGGIKIKGGKIVHDDKTMEQDEYFNKRKAYDINKWNVLINPEMEISEGASKVHGITNEAVKDAPEMEKIIEPFVNGFLNKKNGVIVAYNSKFDITILNNAIRVHNGYSKNNLLERPTYKVLDPFILIQRIHPYMGARKRLSEQYKFLFCREFDGAHDAFADVEATVDVLKYCLYYLSEHRKDKDTPLTLRDVLVFQNGGDAENIDIPLDYKGYNGNVNFDQSYRLVSMPVTNYMQGYKLTGKVLKEVADDIGPYNVSRLEEHKEELYDLNPEDGHPIEPAEMELTPVTGGVENAFYVMKRNFKKVLGFSKLQPYGDKSMEEIIDFIVKKSESYKTDDSLSLWVKNPDPKDIKDGNDLPDIDIARKVMLEKNEF